MNKRQRKKHAKKLAYKVGITGCNHIYMMRRINVLRDRIGRDCHMKIRQPTLEEEIRRKYYAHEAYDKFKEKTNEQATT